jgi:hypothetical protein
MRVSVMAARRPITMPQPYMEEDEEGEEDEEEGEEDEEEGKSFESRYTPKKLARRRGIDRGDSVSPKKRTPAMTLNRGYR